MTYLGGLSSAGLGSVVEYTPGLPALAQSLLTRPREAFDGDAEAHCVIGKRTLLKHCIIYTYRNIVSIYQLLSNIVRDAVLYLW